MHRSFRPRRGRSARPGALVKRGVFTIGCSAALTSIALQPVKAAAFKWKFANAITAEHPINVRAVQAFGKIRTETDGQLDIELFPNNQLGNVTQVLAQLRLGAIEMSASADGVLDEVVPLASINNVGFAFPTRETVFAAMDGDLGAVVRAAISEQGIVAFEKMWENGFRDFTTSSRPIRVVADLDGMKIRVAPSKLRFDTFRSMGIAITPLPSNELYSALQTHIVDGQETPLVYAESEHYYEVQKYASLTHHMWSGYWNTVNLNAWRGLSPKLQEILRGRLNEATVTGRRDVDILYRSVKEKLGRQGLIVNDVDQATFKAKLAASGYYGRWKTQFGNTAWGALEKYAGKLA